MADSYERIRELLEERDRLASALRDCYKLAYNCHRDELPTAIIMTASKAITEYDAQQTTVDERSRGETKYEYEVWQGDVLQAGGSTTDYASAKSEANHYAMMYSPDGPVEVRIYEKRLVAAASRSQRIEENGND